MMFYWNHGQTTFGYIMNRGGSPINLVQYIKTNQLHIGAGSVALTPTWRQRLGGMTLP